MDHNAGKLHGGAMKKTSLAALAAAVTVFSQGLALARTGPAMTEDGLVRVPSSKIGIVYRAPGVSFARYRRVILDPVGVAFKHTWILENKQMRPEQIEALRANAATSFREEIFDEIVTRGQFELTTVAAPDVLKISPYIIRLEVVAPEAGTQQRQLTYVSSSGSMVLVIELHDAASGALIARIVDGEASREYSQLQRTNQLFISAEARTGFARGAQLTHEAISLAQAEREPPSAVAQ
jgi:hypothetical protein